MSLYPLLLEPSLHVKVWGGRKLETVMRKNLPTDEPYGEAWEMHDSATITNGPLAGRTLGDVLAEYGAALVGPAHDTAAGLPLLVKFLDATDWLSVQLHPDDEQAQRLEGEPRGKTEAWYVVDAEPGARLVIGLKPGTTPDEMAAAIRENALENLLVYAPVVAGDVLFVQAGTIHALGPGLLVYEIQQSSDTTYRLYDWGRLGLDGQPRALHIDKGMAVANLQTLPEIVHTVRQTSQVIELVSSPYFTTSLYQLSQDNGLSATLDTQGQLFQILTCIDGIVHVSDGTTAITLDKGRTALIPAVTGAFSLSGPARVLVSAPA